MVLLSLCWWHAEVTGTTITDINGDLDVDGHTDLDFVIVSAATTFQSDIFVGTGATVGFGTTAYFEIMQRQSW